MNDLFEQIIAVKAASAQSSFAYLPELIEYLDLIEEILKQGPNHPKHSKEQRLKIAAGFGRIVTEDFAFSQTELATKMAKIVNVFIS